METVPVTAISVPLGQAQLWMKEWGSGRTERRKLAGKQEAEEDELIVKAQATLYRNFLKNKAIRVASGWVASSARDRGPVSSRFIHVCGCVV